MSRVLVTGDAGFLGSHLCERLVREGNEVVALDNEVTGRRENLAPILGDDRFTYRRQDVSEPFEVDGPLEWVVHLASLASPVFYTERPIETLEVGGPGTYETLTLAR